MLDEPILTPPEVGSFRLNDHLDQFRIVAIGDSNTECSRWERPQRWTGILESFIGSQCKVVNAGMGGTSSNLGLFRWHRDVSPVKPHCVVINFILNDSYIRHYECRSSYVVQCTPDRMDSNLCNMVNFAKAIGASCVFWTSPPVPDWPDNFKSRTNFEIQKEILNSYVKIIERIARDLDVPLVNFWEIFPSIVKDYPGPYFNHPDGYHSNEKSQPIIAKGIAEAVKPIFERWLGKEVGEKDEILY